MAEHEKEIEEALEEFQTKSDKLYKQAFHKGITLTKEMGKFRKCDFALGDSASG